MQSPKIISTNKYLNWPCHIKGKAVWLVIANNESYLGEKLILGGFFHVLYQNSKFNAEQQSNCTQLNVIYDIAITNSSIWIDDYQYSSLNGGYHFNSTCLLFWNCSLLIYMYMQWGLVYVTLLQNFFDNMRIRSKNVGQ